MKVPGLEQRQIELSVETKFILYEVSVQSGNDVGLAPVKNEDKIFGYSGETGVEI